MDILRLFNDFGVDHITEGHKHARRGWVNTPCPFCSGNPGYHLGFNEQYEYFYCWRCGYHHNQIYVLSQILGISYNETVKITAPYRSGNPRHLYTPLAGQQYPYGEPKNLVPLTEKHKQYLRSRRFDPEELEATWGLKSTTPLSVLNYGPKQLSFAYRIFIPVYWNGKKVSYQARDVTGKALQKYLFCPSEVMRVNPKEILYCSPEAFYKPWVVVVEGVTDVWRLGTASVATFGIQFKKAQVRLLSEAFKRVYINYDPEPQALTQAHKLKAELNARGTEAWVINGLRGNVNVDPGDYKWETVQSLYSMIQEKEASLR
jgi:hypothetical protein